MPGKRCSGEPDANPTIREMKAYCEGREDSANGLAVNRHPAGSREADLWDAGHASWTADPAGLPPGDCCAYAPGGGYVPP